MAATQRLYCKALSPLPFLPRLILTRGGRGYSHTVQYKEKEAPPPQGKGGGRKGKENPHVLCPTDKILLSLLLLLGDESKAAPSHKVSGRAGQLAGPLLLSFLLLLPLPYPNSAHVTSLFHVRCVYYVVCLLLLLLLAERGFTARVNT